MLESDVFEPLDDGGGLSFGRHPPSNAWTPSTSLMSTRPTTPASVGRTAIASTSATMPPAVMFDDNLHPIHIEHARGGGVTLEAMSGLTLSNTSSLPGQAVGTVLPRLGGSQSSGALQPYDENQRLRRALGQMRRRQRVLEAELVRAKGPAPSRFSLVAGAYKGEGVSIDAIDFGALGPKLVKPGSAEGGEVGRALTAAQWQAELDQIVAEYESRLAASESLRANENEHLARVANEAAERANQVADAEKQRRVELLRRQVLARLKNGGITRGWLAWADMWRKRSGALKRLRVAAVRLHKPALAACFRDWVWVCEQRKTNRERKTMRAHAQSLESQLREARFEVGQLMLVKTAREDEINSLKLQMQAYADDESARGADLLSVAGAAKEAAELRTAVKIARENEDAAEARMRDAEADVAKQRAMNQQMLETLLHEQRAQFEAELALVREQMSTMSADEKLALEAARVEMAAQSEAEKKAERIASLQRQVARRIVHRGAARGWSAWVEMWQARSYAFARMKQASSRIALREVYIAFATWMQLVRDNEYAKLATDATAYAALEAEMGALQAQLDTTMAERRALRERVDVVEGSMTDAERRRIDQAAAEREARVELLHRQTTRRMMNQGIGRAWAAWHEQWRAKRAALDKLRHVANRLHKPHVSIAFNAWNADLRDAKMAQELNARATLEQALEAELAETHAMHATQLAALGAAHAQALERQRVELTGSHEEVMAVMAAQEKEARVDMLHRKSVRRIASADLVGGFSAWEEMWRARVHALGFMRNAANRMRLPALASAYSHWHRWTVARRQKRAKTAAESRAIEIDTIKRAHKEEMSTMRSDFEDRMAFLAKQMREALEKQAIELTASSEQLEALRAAQAKEERVEMLRKQSLRRIQNRKLAAGWTAWHELWDARASALRRLREVGNKLLKPEMMNAFSDWTDSVEAEKRARERAELRRQRATLAGQLGEAKFEIGQLSMLNTAREDELKALRAQLALLTASAEKSDGLLLDAKGTGAENAELHALTEHAREQVEFYKMAKAATEVDCARRIRENQELLEKLLAEQRGSFVEEIRSAEERVVTAVDIARERVLEEKRRALARRGEEANELEATLRAERDDALAKLRVLSKDSEVAKRAELGLRSELMRARNEADRARSLLATMEGRPAPEAGNYDEQEQHGRTYEELAEQLADQLAVALQKNASVVLNLFKQCKPTSRDATTAHMHTQTHTVSRHKFVIVPFVPQGMRTAMVSSLARSSTARCRHSASTCPRKRSISYSTSGTTRETGSSSSRSFSASSRRRGPVTRSFTRA